MQILQKPFNKVINQRLPQYVMLWKQILKFTKESDKLYDSINQVLQQFESFNTENDQQLKNMDAKAIVVQYQKRFKKLDLLTADCQKHLFDVQLTFIDGVKPFEVECLFFNNCMIFHGKDQPEQILNFNKNSFIQSLVNKKFFKNLFILYGQQGGFIFAYDQKKQLIRQIKEQMKFNQDAVRVEVTGTVQRPEKNNIGFFIKYVVQIEIKQYMQRIFIRNNQLQQIEKMAKQSNIQIFDTKKLHIDISNTKLIESRKLQIQSLIQHILIQQNLQEELLQILGIDIRFFKQQDLQQQDVQYIEGDNLSYFQYQLSNQQFKRVKFIEDKPFMTAIVHLYSFNDQEINIGINQKYRIQNIIDKLSYKLGIKYNSDMEILINQDDQFNILDRDEILLDLKEIKAKKNSISSITKEILHQKIDFFFKKTIFLPLNYEINEYIKNQPKLKFVINQILKDLQIYQFDESKILIIQSLYLYSEYGQNSDIPQKEMINIVQQLTSKNILQKYDIFDYIQNLKKTWNQVINQIEKIDSYNQKDQQIQISNQNKLQNTQSIQYINDEDSFKFSQSFLAQNSNQSCFQSQNKSEIQFNLTQSHNFSKPVDKDISMKRRLTQLSSFFKPKKENMQESLIDYNFDFQSYFSQYLSIVNENQNEINKEDEQNNDVINIKREKKSFFGSNQMNFKIHDKKKQIIAKLAILQILEESNLYGCIFFNAQTYKKNKQDKDNYGQQLYYTDLPDQVLLALKFQGILILNENYETQKLIVYDDIIDTYYQPKSLYIECYMVNQNQKTSVKRFRFDTKNNWEIYSKIQHYIFLNDIKNNKNIEENSNIGWLNLN